MFLKTIIFNIFILLLGVAIGSASVYFYFRTIIPEGLMNAIQSGQIMNRANPGFSNPANNLAQAEATRKKNIGGVITSFSGNAMAIRAYSMNPAISENRNERTVTVIINEQTKLVLMIPKDAEVIRKEMGNYQNTPPTERGIIPSPFTIQEISRDALIIGKQVVVQSVEEITPQTMRVSAQMVGLLPDMPVVPAE